jgi:hypothetical protein
MKLGISILLVTFSLWRSASAETAPDITVVTPGYNLIAKLPCIDCPFFYQDSSTGQNGPWKIRDDENALVPLSQSHPCRSQTHVPQLLNISLPFDSLSLSINTALLLSPSPLLPRIYATQVLLDTSPSTLADLAASNSLDATSSAALGLSYAYSLHRLASPSSGLVFQFDVREACTGLLSSPTAIKLAHPQQHVLEVVLLRRPLYSAGDAADAYEIVRARLIPRISKFGTRLHSMEFRDWDAKGTSAQYIASTSDSLVQSGAWGLFVFGLAVVALFVVVGVFCVFWCGGMDEHGYERAQVGKRRTGNRDVESGRGRFLTAEELGLGMGARVVGVGKGD